MSNCVFSSLSIRASLSLPGAAPALPPPPKADQAMGYKEVASEINSFANKSENEKPLAMVLKGKDDNLYYVVTYKIIPQVDACYIFTSCISNTEGDLKAEEIIKKSCAASVEGKNILPMPLNEQQRQRVELKNQNGKALISSVGVPEGNGSISDKEFQVMEIKTIDIQEIPVINLKDLLKVSNTPVYVRNRGTDGRDKADYKQWFPLTVNKGPAYVILSYLPRVDGLSLKIGDPPSRYKIQGPHSVEMKIPEVRIQIVGSAKDGFSEGLYMDNWLILGIEGHKVFVKGYRQKDSFGHFYNGFDVKDIVLGRYKQRQLELMRNPLGEKGQNTFSPYFLKLGVSVGSNTEPLYLPIKNTADGDVREIKFGQIEYDPSTYGVKQTFQVWRMNDEGRGKAEDGAIYYVPNMTKEKTFKVNAGSVGTVEIKGLEPDCFFVEKVELGGSELVAKQIGDMFDAAGKELPADIKSWLDTRQGADWSKDQATFGGLKGPFSAIVKPEVTNNGLDPERIGFYVGLYLGEDNKARLVLTYSTLDAEGKLQSRRFMSSGLIDKGTLEQNRGSDVFQKIEPFETCNYIRWVEVYVTSENGKQVWYPVSNGLTFESITPKEPNVATPSSSSAAGSVKEAESVKQPAQSRERYIFGRPPDGY